MEKFVEWTVLAGETEVLGENLPWRHFLHHKSHFPDPGANPIRRSGKPATNRFSYGTALNRLLTKSGLSSVYTMMIPVVDTGDGQTNGNNKKLRIRICVGYIERTSVDNTECSVYTL
jgi:hypothetical protein